MLSVNAFLPRMLFPFGAAVLLVSVAVAQNAPGRPDVNAMVSNAAKRAFAELCQRLDRDRDGKLNKTEFMGMYGDAGVAESKYRMWDVNADGYITEEEYVSVVRSIGNKRRPPAES